MSLVIISGDRTEGKTTFVQQYAVWVTEIGRSAGGIVAPAVFEDGKRAGYDVVDLRSGRRRSLARLARPGEEPTIGVYSFDQSAVAAGAEAIMSAVRDGLDMIAIDEVGPIEFSGSGWAPALEHALAVMDNAQTLVVVVRSSLVVALAERFPSPRWGSARRIMPPWPPVADV